MLSLREVSKYGVISGPYFPDTEIDSVNFRIQSEYSYWKIRTRNNSVFGYFLRSVCYIDYFVVGI